MTVSLASGTGTASDVCNDERGIWHLHLALVSISEDCIDDQLDLPVGLIPYPHYTSRPPAWVKATTSSLGASLLSYSKEGFPDLPAQLVTLVHSKFASAGAWLARRGTRAARDSNSPLDHPDAAQ